MIEGEYEWLLSFAVQYVANEIPTVDGFLTLTLYKEENAKLKGNCPEIDCSDISNGETIRAEMAPCKNGRYVPFLAEKGMRYKELPEMRETNEDCDCEICLKRKEFMMPDFPIGSTRSGARRGFYKYGDGHVLGGK